jgi:RNA polymerase sigma-70 factor, ECF subfamily
MDRGGTLEALMARYQAGDLAAATTLIEYVSPQLHRFFAMQPGSREDADDLLQEAWLRIHRARRTYRPGEPVLPWIYAISRRVRVDHYRRSIRRTVREQRLDDLSEATGIPSTGCAHSDDLEELLAPLSESQREILQMLKVAGMSLEEVARATSSSVGSVKQKVHRAYNKLRRRVSLSGLRRRPRGALP